MNLRHLSPRWALAAALSLCVLTHSLSAQDPRRRFGRRRPPSPILTALDADESGTLEKQELAAATKALLGLDASGDGNLQTEELAPRGGRRRRGPPGFQRMDPLVRALDKDGDGELYEDEVTDAAKSLAKLDQDGDGALSEDELRPRFGGRGGFGPPGGFGGRRGGRRGNEETSGETPTPEQLTPEQGRASIPDLATFHELAYQGPEVMVDTHLAGLEFVKFQLEGALDETPRLYFMNTKKFRAHPMFMNAMGMPRWAEGRMRGVLIYWPMLRAPSGAQGLFSYEFEPNDAFSYEMVRACHDLLSRSELLKGRVAYNLLPRSKEAYLEERELYEKSKLPTFEVSGRFEDIAFLPLHAGTGIGRLRVMRGKEIPGPRDIVIYPTLPNEMPRVAGVITEVRQTPLSHVNLRAVQDDIPNAYIDDARKNKKIRELIGELVRFDVGPKGYEIRKASQQEVDEHFAALRPKEAQKPPRDLSVTAIRPLSELSFADAKSVGVKAANLGELRRLGFRGDLTPEGWAIPFAFYDRFMKHNGFYAEIARQMANEEFQDDPKSRDKMLKRFRKAIKKAEMPPEMMDALKEVQKRFPAGTSIRCRSSTNNEDLPGFSGAGLYDSFTHHAREGHLAKSIKQVFASLWNFRAFEERAFHRIDHLSAAMGVVLHPNTKKEEANGVAVTRDVLYQTDEELGQRFYVNAQAGEDLVTNPNASSSPEELLISPRNPRTDQLIRRSTRTRQGARVLSPEQLQELRRALRRIDEHFRSLYAPGEKEPFAMEIEFKVTAENKLFIKQARPWVF